MSGKHFPADGNKLSVSFKYFNVPQAESWGGHRVEGQGEPYAGKAPGLPTGLIVDCTLWDKDAKVASRGHFSS